MSFSLKRRMSLTSYISKAGRSMPIPKAKPVYLVESIRRFPKPDAFRKMSEGA